MTGLRFPSFFTLKVVLFTLRFSRLSQEQPVALALWPSLLSGSKVTKMRHVAMAVFCCCHCHCHPCCSLGQQTPPPLPINMSAALISGLCCFRMVESLQNCSKPGVIQENCPMEWFQIVRIWLRIMREPLYFLLSWGHDYAFLVVTVTLT